ncbi:MAG: hypothetical protein R3F42_08875 [Pseudomonadota bacterium]
MFPASRPFAVGVLALLVGLSLASTAAASPTPSATAFFGLVGNWLGEGGTSDKGRQTPLTLRLECEKVSDGRAVLCRMDGRDQGGNLVLSETDLFGVDPVTGTGHWYAVSNAGETHDHLVKWRNPDTLLASLNWQQEGKEMAENVVLDLSSASYLNIRSIVSADGVEVAEFTGSFRQQ